MFTSFIVVYGGLGGLVDCGLEVTMVRSCPLWVVGFTGLLWGLNGLVFPVWVCTMANNVLDSCGGLLYPTFGRFLYL